MSAAPKRSHSPVFAPVIEVPPGPNAGRVWRDQRVSWCDATTGLRVTQLTNYRGHSHHRVGPKACWLDDGRRIALVSDRDGCGNLFAYDFDAHELVQLTDLRGGDQPTAVRLVGADRIAFRYGAAGFELELSSLRLRRSARARSLTRGRIKQLPSMIAGEQMTTAGKRALWVAAQDEAPVVLAVLDAPADISHARTAGLAMEPCMGPDGKRVVFTALAGSYTQVHAVDVESWAGLPALADLTVAAKSGRRSTSPRG